MKIFEVADALNGFVCGFDVYCGKNQVSCANDAKVFDKDCTQTTKTVVGLLDSLQLLEKGLFVYLDNYYNSYELNLELLGQYTFVSGTARKNRKGNSKAFVNAKLKKRGSSVQEEWKCTVFEMVWKKKKCHDDDNNSSCCLCRSKQEE